MAWPWYLILLGAVLFAYLMLILVVLLLGRREEARALAGFLPDCVVLLARLARDPCVPRLRGFVLIGLIAYLSSPIDLIPDFIPGLGQLDDVVILALGLRWALSGCSRETIESHWPGPGSSLPTVLRLTGAAGR